MKADEVKAALLARAEEVCRHLLPNGKLKSNHWRIGNLDGEPGESLAISLEKGSFYDHATGDKGGNLLDLWMAVRSLSFREALAEAGAWLGIAPIPPAIPSRPKSKPSKRFDWNADVQQLSEKQIAHVAQGRGFPASLVRLLSKKGVIGYHPESRRIAFPVANASGAIQKAHLFDPEWKRRPFYAGDGELTPLIVGEITNAKTVHAHESQWDLIADLGACGWHRGECEGVAFVATRGASNGDRIGSLVQSGQALVLVSQNDKAAESWLADAVGSLSSGVSASVARPPDGIKDWNDWLKETRKPDSPDFAQLAKDAISNAEQITLPKPPQLPRLSESEGFGSLGSFGNEEEDEKPFPLEAMPNALAAMAREISRVELVPESMAGAAVLGVASAAIGAGLEIATVGNKRTRANLFTLIVAESGTGKDSTMNPAAAPLREIEAEQSRKWREETEGRLRGNLDAIDAQISKAKKQKMDEASLRDLLGRLRQERVDIERQLTHEPALTVADVTKEAFANVIAGQPGEAVFSVSSESRGIVGILKGRYTNGQSDEDIYTGGFSGTPTKVNRQKARPLRLDRPCLSVLWMLQPDSFATLLRDPAMVESGFMGRFVFFDPKAKAEPIPESPLVFSDSIREAWRRLIRELVETFHENGDEPETVEASDEAREVLRQFDNECRKRRNPGGDLADVASFAARWAEIAWRVALTFHAAEHGGDADKRALESETASRAVKLVRWFAGEALRLLENGREERRSERAAKFQQLLAGANGEMKLRDLRRRGFEPVEVERIARRYGRIRIEERQNPKGGPRSTVAKLISETGRES